MDKSNRKLKRLYNYYKYYKCIKANTSAPTTISSPNRSKKRKKRATQKSLPFGKSRFREKKDQEDGRKAEKDKTNSDRTRQKNKRGGIEKWDQTGREP